MVQELTINLSQITYTHAYWIFLLPLIGAAADILTGWIQASVNGTWDSTKMRRGLYRKGGEFAVVLLGYVAECAVLAAQQAHVATFLSMYIVIMEALSVIENLDQAGVVMPTFIRRKLGKVKESMDKDDEE